MDASKGATGVSLNGELQGVGALRARAAVDCHFAAAISLTDDAIATLTPDGLVATWNNAAVQRYGFAAEEMIGARIERVVPPHRRGELAEVLRAVKRGDQIRGLSTQRLARNGLCIEVSLSAAPIRTSDGAIVGVATVEKEISERWWSEERFAAALEAAPSGMLVVEADGAISFANSEAERMFGYAHGELLGRSIDLLAPEAARGHHAEQRVRFLAEPRRRLIGSGRDFLAQRKDGSRFPVEIGLNPVETWRGVSVLAVVTDITARKRAEDHLKAQAQELERSNADLEQFAYVASHDLQEPLRMVASYTQLLAERYKGRLDERADRYIGYAVDGARRMQDLVRDLLSYARVSSAPKELTPVDAGMLAKAVLEDMAPILQATGGVVEIEALPVVAADVVQLRQVFQNLIGNALKFRSAAPPHVCVRASAAGDLAAFHVEDNGIGIEPRHFERIFQMFQRLHERGSYEGSGIGLAIVNKIVERHGGRVWIDSTPGVGTTVSFSWPKRA